MRRAVRRAAKARLLARLVFALLGAAALACSVFTALAVWDARGAAEAAHEGARGPSFARVGERYVAVDPAMVRQSFTVRKSPGEFRVFVLGSSQAMGSPYVHQKLNVFSGTLLGMPNEGGISTWLAVYLKRLMPGRTVTVVNAAKGGRTFEDSVATLAQVLEIGRPDAVIVLDGNNERSADVGPDRGLRPEADFERALASITRRFEKQIQRAVELSERAQVPIYALTTPNNLRDWAPRGAPGRPDDPQPWMERGRILEARGDYLEARRSYVRAKDLDRAFLRARTDWNKLIRRVKSPTARVLDLERLMFEQARHGIPGRDLFHDYCHMTLAANRLAGYAIALRLRADFKMARPLLIEDADLGLFETRQLRLLYCIKAFKWARSRWFGRLSMAQDLNAKTASQAYLQEADIVEERLRLYVGARARRR